MKYLGKTDEYFELIDIDRVNCDILKEQQQDLLSFLWFTSDGNQLVIDSVEHTFNTNQVVCLTEFHGVDIKEVESLRLLRFNKPFYCILNHDSEVGCTGILYFGSSKVPIIQLEGQDLDILEKVWDMLRIEMVSRDNLQLEMLQMMLKRILILSTRIYKAQHSFEKLETEQDDIVRKFNFQVEQYFREKHTVTEYAELLNKSPKTLSNVFKKLGNRTPLQLIQDRRMLEARRLLRHSDKSVSEISDEIGFADVQSFSRFFKKNEGVSPTNFKEKGENLLLGKN